MYKTDTKNGAAQQQSDNCRKSPQEKKAKKIKADHNFIGSNREKSNIAITILKNRPI